MITTELINGSEDCDHVGLLVEFTNENDRYQLITLQEFVKDYGIEKVNTIIKNYKGDE